MICAYQVPWTEYESGWGQRPDGNTLYLSKEAADAHIKKYWDQMPDGPAPACYSSPGTPRLVESTEEQIAKIASAPEQFIWA